MGGKADLKLELTNLKARVDNVLEETKGLRLRMAMNSVQIQDTLKENKQIEMKLEMCETKMLVVAQKIIDIVEREEEIDDFDNGEDWFFEDEMLSRLQNNDKEGICEEVGCSERTVQSPTLKITAVAYPDVQEAKFKVDPLYEIEVTIEDEPSCPDTEYEDKAITATAYSIMSDETEERPSCKTSKSSEPVALKVIGKVKKVVKIDVEKIEKAVTANKMKLKVTSVDITEKAVTLKDMTRRKSVDSRKYLKRNYKQLLTGASPASLRKKQLALNESVIDCDHVLKKSVLKEKQVMTPSSKSYTSAAPLSAHLMNHYGGLLVMECPFHMCFFNSADQQKLTQHMRSKHTREQLFNCHSCEATFSTFDAKTVHERKHSNAGLEQCGRCLRFHQIHKSCSCSVKQA